MESSPAMRPEHKAMRAMLQIMVAREPKSCCRLVVVQTWQPEFGHLLARGSPTQFRAIGLFIRKTCILRLQVYEGYLPWQPMLYICHIIFVYICLYVYVI